MRSALTIIATITLMIAAIGFATLADAQPHRAAYGKGKMGHDGHFGRLMEEALDLSEEQAGEIRALREAYRPSLEETGSALREAQRALHEAVRTQVDNGQVDESSLSVLGPAIADAQVEMAATRARMQIEIHALLTPEQLEKAAEMRSLHQERREQRRERAHRRPHQRGFGGPGSEGAPSVD